MQRFNPDGSTSRDVEVEVGDDVRVSSSEPGVAYLVRTDKVPADLAGIEMLDDEFWNSVALNAGHQSTDMFTEGLVLGEYELYTRDDSGLWSAASAHQVVIEPLILVPPNPDPQLVMA
ncbi:MAG: hypothetical protein FJY42_05930 [Betaproteobacteria bacterium]|nr:hypothetical protein [Betaproteobacteria bacterium]